MVGVTMSEQEKIEKQMTWNRLEKNLGKTLIPFEKRKSWKQSVDKKISFHLLFSKFYPADSRYWYGIKKDDISLWEIFDRSFVVFVLGDSQEIMIIPALELKKGLENTYIQPTSGNRYKVHILRENNNFYFLEIKDLEINRHYNNFNQITVSSASDYEDSDYQIKEVSKDYLSPVPKYGRGGESTHHKNFKEFIAKNPSHIGINGSEFTSEIEFILPSMDAIDVIFSNKEQSIGVEVKSKISGIDDITRGLFQCVKYNALLRALYLAQKRDVAFKAILVLENQFPQQLLELKNILGIEVYDNIAISENISSD